MAKDTGSWDRLTVGSAGAGVDSPVGPSACGRGAGAGAGAARAAVAGRLLLWLGLLAARHTVATNAGEVAIAISLERQDLAYVACRASRGADCRGAGVAREADLWKELGLAKVAAWWVGAGDRQGRCCGGCGGACRHKAADIGLAQPQPFRCWAAKQLA